jgi:adenylate kinase family enzyme
VKGYYIIIRGPLGIGKSTIAERLSKELNAEHIEIDRVLDEFKKEWEEGYISQKSFIKANGIAARRAKALLDRKRPVIFDGNFYHMSQIEDLIGRLDYPHHVFTLTAPLKVCIERDSKRSKTHGRDAAKVVYRKSTEFRYGTDVDATKPVAKIIKEMVSNLGE